MWPAKQKELPTPDVDGRNAKQYDTTKIKGLVGDV